MISLLIIFSGCSHSQKELDPSVRHILKSDKFQIIMQKLDSVIYERRLSELDRDRRRGRYVNSLSQTLREFSDELALIESSDTSSDDAILYKEYSKRIIVQADKLEILAKKQTFKHLEKNIKDIENICNSCHVHYGIEHKK